MVEGDLVDLTLPTLLQAVAREGSTAVLRMQRGTDHGALYFCEGSLMHAQAGQIVGDEAVAELLGWPDGRFRLARDAEQQPRTVSQRLASLVVESSGPRPAGGTSSGSPQAPQNGDGQLLNDLLTLLARLDQDKVRLEEGKVQPGTVPALLLLTAAVNSMIAVVTARCNDPAVLPSRVLPRLAEEHPYTQMLGEEMDRISIATAAGVLKTWSSAKEDRDQLYLELCRALLQVMKFYGNTTSTFFHGSHEREEWRATFGVFVDGLWTASHAVGASA